MASGFKTATIQTGQVTGTLTDFPVTVDLSDVGITTLAEAESVRVYSDSAKSTELAREIVSATEMYVKVPSASTSTSIYVDFDGVQSDYAATATYGRNNVWSDYYRVFHLNESSGSVAVDSTGNQDGTYQGSLPTQVTSDYINGHDLVIGNGDYVSGLGTAQLNNQDFTVTSYLHRDTSSNFGVLGKNQSGVSFEIRLEISSGNTLRNRIKTSPGTDINFTGSTNLAAGTDYHCAWTFDVSAIAGEVFVNGSSDGTGTGSGTMFANSSDLVIGASRNDGGTYPYDGSIYMLRVRREVMSDDWISAESNCVMNPTAFWGTWTDVTVTEPDTVNPNVSWWS